MKMISVIIITLNEEKYIEGCLRSLAKQTLPRSKYEIIVVDGGSRDNTVKIAKKYADKIVYQNRKGAANARNWGYLCARYPLVAYIDADVVVEKGWIKKAAEKLESPDIVCAFGRTYPRENYLGSRIYFSLANFYAKFCDYFKSPNVMGPHMVFKKWALKKCGGFNERIPSLEDYEIAFRLIKCGKLVYCPKLIAYASSRRFKKFGYFSTFFGFLYDGLRIFLGFKPKQKHDYGVF